MKGQGNFLSVTIGINLSFSVCDLVLTGKKVWRKIHQDGLTSMT